MEGSAYTGARFNLALLSFLLVFLIVSPYLHEQGHFLAIARENCDYTILDYKWTLFGCLSLTTEIMCPLTAKNYPPIFLAGILSTFLAGNLLILAAGLDYLLRSRIHIITLYSGFGLVLHSLIYFFEEGEAVLALEMLGLSAPRIFLLIAGSFLLFAYLLIVVHFMDIYAEREVAEERGSEFPPGEP